MYRRALTMNLAFVMTCLWVAVPVQAREVTFKPAQMLRAIQDEASPKTPVFPKIIAQL